MCIHYDWKGIDVEVRRSDISPLNLQLVAGQSYDLCRVQSLSTSSQRLLWVLRMFSIPRVDYIQDARMTY